MITKKRLLDYLFAITHPNFWISDLPSSPIVDEFVNEVIDKNMVIRVTEYRAYLSNGDAIWIGNYPYQYGEPLLSSNSDANYIPYRRTRARLRKYIHSLLAYELRGMYKYRERS